MFEVTPLPVCAYQYAEAYSVPLQIIQAVRIKESGGNQGVGKVCANSDGSCDIGAMQINEWWLPKLHKQNIDANLLIEDECVNIAVGTWILAANFYQHKNWADALAVYNTGKKNTVIGQRYAEQVIKIYKALNRPNNQKTQ